MAPQATDSAFVPVVPQLNSTIFPGIRINQPFLPRPAVLPKGEGAVVAARGRDVPDALVHRRDLVVADDVAALDMLLVLGALVRDVVDEDDWVMSFRKQGARTGEWGRPMSPVQASIRRSPLGSGTGSPNSRAVSIQSAIASLMF